MYLLLSMPVFAEFDPEPYHESNIGQFKHAIKEMPKLDLKGSETMLDIGSGDGLLSEHIAKTYIPDGQLIGIDNSNEMVRFATSRNEISNVSYKCEDAAAYKVANTYDVIVSFWTLHWISDYAKVIENIAASLKPNGRTLLCHVVGVDPFTRIINELLTTEEWKEYAYDSPIFQPPFYHK